MGIPIILLHDAEGGMVTVELKNGSIYRGILEYGQDNMNCTLKVSLSLSLFVQILKLIHFFSTGLC